MTADTTTTIAKPATSLRKKIIYAYITGYLVIIVAYIVFLFTSSYSLTPEEYLFKAFPNYKSLTREDLYKAAKGLKNSFITPAEVRFVDHLSFENESGQLVTVEPGNRITLPHALDLGMAIIADAKKPESIRNFQHPFAIYKENFLANTNWGALLNTYNLLGFYLLIILFLIKPISNYLAKTAKRSAAEYSSAMDAKNFSEKLKEDYKNSLIALEKNKQLMEENAKRVIASELSKTIESAKNESAELLSSLKASLEAEEHNVATRIHTETLRTACANAKLIVQEKVTPEDHAAAIDTLVADLEKIKLTF